VIEEYGFRNFRAFSSGAVHVRPITVLLGANGQGKTSVLQPLLIMKQTLEAPEENARVGIFGISDQECSQAPTG